MPAPAFRWASVLLLVFGLSLVSSTEAFAVTRDRAPAASPVSAQWRLSCAADRNGNLRISSSKCYVNGAAASLSSCRSLARPTTAQCPSNSWSPGSWGQCSATCGGGTQTRPVTCQSSYGTTVANSLCSDAKPATAQSCNPQACPIYTWSTGAWSSCSKTCGGGTQTRAVSCKNGGTAVADSFCAASKPAPSQSCNTSTCQATDTTPPAVPTGLAASTSTCKQVDLSWKPSTDTGGSGLARYEVYRNNGYLTSVQSPFAGMADASVAPSTSYSYEVAAVDNAGNPSGRSAARTATTPACPATGGPIIGKTAAPRAFLATGLAVESGVAVCATQDSAGGSIQVFDVSQSAAPRHLRELPLGDGAVGLQMGGGIAYTMQVHPGTSPWSELLAIDLRNPTSPRVMSRLTLPGASTTESLFSPISLSGSTLFAAATTGGVIAIDVANPAAPRILSTLTTLGTNGSQSRLRSVSASASYVYVVDNEAFRVVDVKNPLQMRPSGIAWGLAPTNLVHFGATVFSLRPGVLRAYDTSKPTLPTPLGLGTLENGPTDLAWLDNNRLVYSSAGGGFYVLNVSNPADPVLIQHGETKAATSSIAVANGLVYTADVLGNLYIADPQ